MDKYPRKECPLKFDYKPGSYGFLKSQTPTRYVFVANLSPNGQKPNFEQLKRVFCIYSKNYSIFETKNPNCLNIDFKSVISATKFKTDYSSLNCKTFNGRLFKVFFSCPKPIPKTPFGSQLDCVCEFSEVKNPPGLFYFPNFISDELESSFLNLIDSKPWQTSFGRRVQHYGYKFDHITRKVDKTPSKVEAIPPSFLELYNFFNASASLMELEHNFEKTDQTTINEYLPGNGIRYHIDSHSSFKDFIFVISLQSPIVMNLRNAKTKAFKPFFLEPRSLLVLSGESRYSWQHGIPLRKTDFNCSTKKCDQSSGVLPRGRRVSVTFRRVSFALSCKCRDHVNCDFPSEQMALNKSLPSVRSTPEIERDHVQKVYSMIATHFAHTRGIKWPHVTEFLGGLKPNSVVVDIACGNGKYFDLVPKNSIVFGLDNCAELVSIANRRSIIGTRRKGKDSRESHDSLIADAINIPFRDSFADYSISIALLHHISTPERRLECAREILRILKPSGVAFVCAWAFKQDEKSRFKFNSEDALVDWNLQSKHFDKETKKTFQEEGYQLDRDKNIIVQRYCHLFREGELKSLFESCGAKILSCFYDYGNWYVLIEK